MSKTIPGNVLVADVRKAILLRNEGSGGEMSLHEKQRLSPKDLLNNGPSGLRPEEQLPRQTGEATFAKQVAEALYSMNQAGTFKALVLVADPRTLGQFRDAMHKTGQERGVLTLAKSLTNYSVREITQALP